MLMLRCFRSLFFMAVLVVPSALAQSPPPGDDWPTYLHDAARSGFSALPLATPEATAWEFPLERVQRVTPPVISGGRVFFGATNHKLYALDAASG